MGGSLHQHKSKTFDSPIPPPISPTREFSSLKLIHLLRLTDERGAVENCNQINISAYIVNSSLPCTSLLCDILSPPSSKVFTRVTPVECLHYIPNLEKYFVTGDAAFARVAQKKIEFKYFIRLLKKKVLQKSEWQPFWIMLQKRGQNLLKHEIE